MLVYCLVEVTPTVEQTQKRTNLNVILLKQLACKCYDAPNKPLAEKLKFH